MNEQRHLPNPTVDRVNRPQILEKRIRNLKGRFGKNEFDNTNIKYKKLTDYQNELSALRQSK